MRARELAQTAARWTRERGGSRYGLLGVHEPRMVPLRTRTPTTDGEA